MANDVPRSGALRQGYHAARHMKAYTTARGTARRAACSHVMPPIFRSPAKSPARGTHAAR